MKKCYCDNCKKKVDLFELNTLNLQEDNLTIHREFCDICYRKIEDFFKWKFTKKEQKEIEKKYRKNNKPVKEKPC